MTGDAHAIEVTALHEYGSWVYPGEISGATDPTDYSYDLTFRQQRKVTFECECGRRFRKWPTAFDHLREHAPEAGGDE